MKRVLLLRAYGDFIVALQSVLNSPLRDEFEIIASTHHQPLFESLKGAIDLEGLQISFQDWHIQSSQLRIFTNRHLVHPHTIQELRLLRQFLQKNSEHGQVYLDQPRRKKLLEFLTGKKMQTVSTGGPVYIAFHRFFKTEKAQISSFLPPKSKVLILPSARIKKRDLPENLVTTIQNKHLDLNDQVSIAYFKDPKRTGSTSYSSFHELVQLISQAQFVYGADSLPIHLSYLLKKPHYILYPPNGSHQFFTPFALENQFFSTFDGFK